MLCQVYELIRLDELFERMKQLFIEYNELVIDIQYDHTLLDTILVLASEKTDDFKQATWYAKKNILLMDLEERITSIEKNILEDPSKAVSIVLLKKEIDNLRTNYEKDILILSNSVNSVFNQSKWFLGIIALMAINFLVITIRIFWKPKNV